MITGKAAALQPRIVALAMAIMWLISSVNAADGGGGGSSAAVLIEFKNSLTSSPNGGAINRALISWNLSISPCAGNVGNWFGVRCLNGDVMGLQLDNLNLAGDIDVEALIPLRFLRIMSFENNNFEGLMPDWRKLGALKSLFLSNNRFSGRIADDAFSSMGSLKKIHLANNRFTGEIPTSLATTPRLLELRLENNGFTGRIPEFQPGLRLFNASNNHLDGPIPSSLSFMDPSAFSGNKGLCGKPLVTACKAQSPPPKPSPEKPHNGGPSVTDSLSSPNLTKALMTVAIILLTIAALISLITIFRGRRQQTQLDKVAIDPLYSPYNPQATSSPSVTPSPDRAIGSGGMPSSRGNPSPSPTQSPAVVVGKLAFVRADRTQFDLQDLLRASAEVLGSGDLGSSYKAVLMDGQAVVVKRFKYMNVVRREDFHEHMRRLARLEHPNLLPLVAYYYRKDEKLLVSDFAVNGSLASHLHGKGSRLDWGTRVKVIKGVAKAMWYLHKELSSSLTLPHAHLKSTNVLLDASFNPVLMDYALSPVLNADDLPTILFGYKSPDYTDLRRPNRKSDVWTLGVLILETLTATCITKFPAPELQAWVGSVSARAGEEGNVDESVFDSNLGKEIGEFREKMVKLLLIGVCCCRKDLDDRVELKEAVARIESL